MENKVRVKFPLSTSFLDYPDGKSLAVIVYMLGCSHNCDGCYNKELQDKDYLINTSQFTKEELLEKILIYCKKNQTNKVCLEGGDPLYKYNKETTIYLLKFLWMNGVKVCLYTGYDMLEAYSYLKDISFMPLDFIIKCGKYNKDLKCDSKKIDKYLQLVSSNQEFYSANFIKLSENGRFYFN